MQETILPILAIIVSVFSMLAGYLGLFERRSGRHTDIVSRLTVLEKDAASHVELISRMSRMEATCDMCRETLRCLPDMKNDIQKMHDSMDVFWKVVDPALAQLIHSPIHVDRDALMDKLASGTLTAEECQALDEKLQEMVDEASDMQTKLVGKLLQGRVAMIQVQLRGEAGDTSCQAFHY